MHSAVKAQAELLRDEKVVVLFSGGKDAVVTAHLWLKYHKNVEFIFFYFVAGLSFAESILRVYERQFGVKIHRFPCGTAMSLEAGARNLRKQAFNETMAERSALKALGLQWTVSGAKRLDGFARRGQLAAAGPYGIDHTHHHVFPVINWSDKQVHAYCSRYALPLPITYSMGLKRSLWVPDTRGLIWIKEQFPRDYARIIAKYPQLEHGVFRERERLRR